MSGELVMITGGARAGKSDFAADLARGAGRDVLFVATARAGDDEMRERIAHHRASRPVEWDTLEEPIDPAGALARHGGRYDAVVLDCLTLWVSNLFLTLERDRDVEAGLVLQADREVQASRIPEVDREVQAGRILENIRELLAWHQGEDSSLIIVTNEVGMGIVPDNPLGRLYRDVLGKANRLVAASADRVYLLVAGVPMQLKPPFSGEVRP